MTWWRTKDVVFMLSLAIFIFIHDFIFCRAFSCANRLQTRLSCGTTFRLSWFSFYMLNIFPFHLIQPTLASSSFYLVYLRLLCYFYHSEKCPRHIFCLLFTVLEKKHLVKMWTIFAKTKVKPTEQILFWRE